MKKENYQVRSVPVGINTSDVREFYYPMKVHIRKTVPAWKFWIKNKTVEIWSFFYNAEDGFDLIPETDERPLLQVPIAFNNLVEAREFLKVYMAAEEIRFQKEKEKIFKQIGSYPGGEDIKTFPVE